MSIIKWYEITCDTCGNAIHFQGNLSSVQEQFKKTGGVIKNDKKHYCNEKCKPAKKRAETCECCGRDLPESEICGNCGHNNHHLQLSGRACKKIMNEIESERGCIV